MFKKIKAFFGRLSETSKKFTVPYIFLGLILGSIFAHDILSFRFAKKLMSPEAFTKYSTYLGWGIYALFAGLIVSVFLTLLFEYKKYNKTCKLSEKWQVLLNLVTSLFVSGALYAAMFRFFRVFTFSLSSTFYLYYTIALGLLIALIVVLPMFFNKKYNSAEYLTDLALKLLGIGVLTAIVSILTSIVVAFTLDVLNFTNLLFFIPTVYAFVSILIVAPQIFAVLPIDLRRTPKLSDTAKTILRILHSTLQVFWVIYTVLLYIYTVNFFTHLDEKFISPYVTVYLIISASLLVLEHLKMSSTKNYPKKLFFAIAILSIIQAFVMFYALWVRIAAYGLTIPRGYGVLFTTIYVASVAYILYSLYKNKNFSYKTVYFIAAALLAFFTFVPGVNIVDMSIRSLANRYDKSSFDIVTLVLEYKGAQGVKQILGQEAYNKYRLDQATKYLRTLQDFEDAFYRGYLQDPKFNLAEFYDKYYNTYNAPTPLDIPECMVIFQQPAQPKPFSLNLVGTKLTVLAQKQMIYPGEGGLDMRVNGAHYRVIPANYDSIPQIAVTVEQNGKLFQRTVELKQIADQFVADIPKMHDKRLCMTKVFELPRPYIFSVNTLNGKLYVLVHGMGVKVVPKDSEANAKPQDAQQKTAQMQRGAKTGDNRYNQAKLKDIASGLYTIEPEFLTITVFVSTKSK